MHVYYYEGCGGGVEGMHCGVGDEWDGGDDDDADGPGGVQINAGRQDERQGPLKRIS